MNRPGPGLHTDTGGSRGGYPTGVDTAKVTIYGYRPGSRAYLSVGLPGAEWSVAGPVAGRAEEADVELDEVQRFLTSAGLWDCLT